jgi:hypothetical protein
MLTRELILKSRIISRCRRCKKYIGLETMIRWRRGEGATHLDEAHCEAAEPDTVPLTYDNPAAELAAVGALLEAACWTFAKTYTDPDALHFWSTRRQWRDSAAFTRCVEAIKALGVKKRWRTMRNHYLEIGPWDYWTMDPRPCAASLSTLINRADRVASGAQPVRPPALPLETTDAERAE